MEFLIDVTVMFGAPTSEQAWREVNAAASAEEFPFEVAAVSEPDFDGDGEVYLIDVTVAVEADDANEAWEHVVELARAEEFPFEVSHVDEAQSANATGV